MERALYIKPNLVSKSPIQRASAVLPFVMRSLVCGKRLCRASENQPKCKPGCLVIQETLFLADFFRHGDFRFMCVSYLPLTVDFLE